MKRLHFVTVSMTVVLVISLLVGTCAAEKYHLILISDPSPQTILILAELGLPLDDARSIKGRGLEIPVRESDVSLVENRGISYQIIQEDLEKHYAEICLHNLENIPGQTDEDPAHMKYGTMGGFYNFGEIVADLDSMYLLYPDLCTEKQILGYGWDENPIYMVKISDNAVTYEGEPEGIFDALHHAREPGGYTAMIYAMWYLLENYGTDPDATYLVDNRELYFVPVVNPDGLLYNELNNPYGGGMWRKNRRNNGGGEYGVDLNRNYPYQWGYDNQGSSPNPGSSTYRGPSAGSEPETQTMMNFIGEHDFRTGMTVHTSGEKYLTAYGYDDVPPEHYDVHMDYLSAAAAENGYTYGYCYSIMYSSNGRTQDWQLHEHDIINVEPEIGDDGFWPDIGFIMLEARENLDCFLNQFWCAGGHVVFSGVEVVDEFLTPGETEELIVTIFNRGWGTSEAVNFEIETTDPFITLSNTSAAMDTLSRRTYADNSASPAIAIVDPDCPVGHVVEFTITIDQGGYIRTDQTSLIVGTPVVFFEDDAESGMGNWSSFGGWDVDDDNPHGGEYSFSDSPGRDYYDNANAVMALAQPVNLSEATQIWLDFWARWDIEANWDFCQLEVSTNGFTWAPVGGLYTAAGSGQGVQPYGEPGYEGAQATWIHEFIDLNTYAGASYFMFRFEFKSDGGVVGDGFFVDDIQLLGFTESGTPPDITATLTPYNPPIQIPASGGSFDFNIALSNNEATPETFDAWIMVTLPNGMPFGPVLGPVNLTLPGGNSIDRERTQDVPGGAPTGMYTYTANIGLYPTTIWTDDSFTFEKLPNGDGVPIGEWNNTGEDLHFISPDQGGNIPDDFALIGAYPNPFNPETHIVYALPEAARVHLSVYDISGRVVATLVNGWRDVGMHKVTLDGSALPSGIYLYKLQASTFCASGKMVLMK